MKVIVLSALGLSSLVYIVIGFVIGRNNKTLGDFLPLQLGRTFYIKNSFEFSSSQTAAIISIATVIVAFYQFAHSVGFWLFWSVFTVAIGFICIRWMSVKIHERLKDFKYIPTLHEFLGQSFDSPTLRWVSSTATILGFLAAYALELSICARVLSPLLPDIPLMTIVMTLFLVGLIYTTASGYRGVVVTDIVMMGFIWLFFIAVSFYYMHHFATKGGFTTHFNVVVEKTINPELNGSTLPFMLIAFFIINTFAYMADQSVFQRIVSVNKSVIAKQGIKRSIIGLTTVHIWLLFLACFVFAIITFDKNEYPISTFLKHLGTEGSVFSNVVLFIAVLGLVGASLSTASTLLVSCANTFYSDILIKIKNKKIEDQVQSISGLRFSRFVLVISAFVSIFIVELCFYFNFDIIELILAIFSSQLGMCIPLILALTLENSRLKQLSNWATWAVIIGFVTGWGTIIIAKIIDAPELISLSAIVSWGSSSGILGIGLLLKRKSY